MSDDNEVSTSTLTLEPSTTQEAASTSTLTLSHTSQQLETEVLTSIVRLSPTTSSTTSSSTIDPTTVVVTRTRPSSEHTTSTTSGIPISIVPISLNSTTSTTIPSSATSHYSRPTLLSTAYDGPSCWEPTAPCGTAVIAGCSAAVLAILVVLGSALYFKRRRKSEIDSGIELKKVEEPVTRKRESAPMFKFR